MTEIPAGWYPDPAPETLPGRLRYWDGQQWTTHVHDPQPVPAAPRYPEPVAPQAYPQAYGQQYAQPSGQVAPQAYAQQYTQQYTQEYAHPEAKPRPTTPDGQLLSGWWRRVAAQLIDGLILSPVLFGILALFLASRWDTIREWLDDYSNAVDAGTSPPSPPDLFSPFSATMLAMVATYLIVLAIYTLGFWHWKQATPGKLAVGVRIRRREAPGPMPWSTMLTRFLFVEALAVAAYVPVVGILFVLTSLLDDLWPLWDRKNQALHDKVARTNVVLAPPRPVQPVGGPGGASVTPTREEGLPPVW
jgi:uncharacterized RDD family membrane protein YckC